MIYFDNTKFIDRKHIQVNVQVPDLSYFTNVYIDRIVVTSDNEFEKKGYVTDKGYILVPSGNTKNQTFSVSLADLGESGNEPKLYYIYVKIKGTPASDTPCGMDNEWDVYAVADLHTIYDKAVHLMNCGNDCGCSDDACHTNTRLANFSLEYYRLKSSLEFKDFENAIDSFNKLTGITVKNEYIPSNCGCRKA